MSDRPEPLADIANVIRIRAANISDGGAMADGAELRDIADRIEAAAKRERAEWHAETEAAKEARNRVANRMRSEFAAKCRDCTERAHGNAAALREALERIVGWCEGCHADVCEKVCRPGLTSESIHAALAALAAPARNCDVSRDTNKTIERCLACLNVESSSASFDAGVCAAIGWMLSAPAEGGSHA